MFLFRVLFKFYSELLGMGQGKDTKCYFKYFVFWIIDMSFGIAVVNKMNSFNHCIKDF